ncbi:MAG TPA: Asp-tRNA(Asn)/Glu-tRNA(Gln) amidotransferase subunit GatC [Bacillota bacterium]|nr:Asp-tRNA(Asn)/Glu-tRNA(Gln) amidotransferase subunit GatC [Bacillota bacterium]
MRKVTKEEVMELANVARLSVTDDEVTSFETYLNDILTYADEMNELDTADVKPTTHVLDLTNVMRKDEATEQLTQDEALKNAPSHKDGQFKVPSILK